MIEAIGRKEADFEGFGDFGQEIKEWARGRSPHGGGDAVGARGGVSFGMFGSFGKVVGVGMPVN